MKKIDKLILKAFLGPFFATFFILQFIFLLQHIWLYLDDMIGKGLSILDIFKMIYYTFFLTVPRSLPLTVILASIMSIGNLSEHNELTALKSSGVSFLRILKPLFVTSFVITIIAFVFSNNIMPWSVLKHKAIMRDIVRKKLQLNIQEGVFYTDFRNHSIRINKKHKNGKDVEDVVIFKQTTNGNINVTKATSGKISFSEDRKYFIFDLYDGSNYEERFKRRNTKDYKELPHIKTIFKHEKIRFDMTPFQIKSTDSDIFKGDAKSMTLSQLNVVTDSLKRRHQKLKTDLSNNLEINLKVFSKTNNADSIITANNKEVVKIPLPKDYREFVDPTKRNTVLNMLQSDIRSTYNRILNYKARLKSAKKRLIKTDMERHKKFTLALSCILLFMVGAPIGAVIKKGGIGLPVVISVVFFLIFHMLTTFGEKSVAKDEMDLTLGIWLANIVFLPFGILFMIQSATDSPLFDRNFYKKLVKRLIRK